MAPFLQLGFLTEGWSLFFTFLIGLFFGLVLEQSGFSSSRKLAGIFFGYDFVVLKVFFTAGITAMTGLILFQYFGLIEMSQVFINSNFLWSAVSGGVIMGFGFIIGGFCPGTSITGATIGKIDAWFFILGVFIGVFLFGVFEPKVNFLFSGYYFDGEFIYNTLGMQRSWFVLLMIIMAISAFAVGHYFENNATKGLKPTNERYRSYKVEIIVLLLIGIVIIMLPENSSRKITEMSEHKLLQEIVSQEKFINPEELAYDIIWNKPDMKVIDVRTADEFKTAHLPGAINIPVEQFLQHETIDLLKDNNISKILVSNGGKEASRVWIYAKRKNYKNISILKGGLNGFVKTVFFTEKPDSTDFHYDHNGNYLFLSKAAEFFKSGEAKQMQINTEIQNSDSPAPAKKTAGGC